MSRQDRLRADDWKHLNDGVEYSKSLNLYLYKGRIEVSGTKEEFLLSENPAVRDFLQASGVRAAER